MGVETAGHPLCCKMVGAKGAKAVIKHWSCTGVGERENSGSAIPHDWWATLELTILRQGNVPRKSFYRHWLCSLGSRAQIKPEFGCGGSGGGGDDVGCWGTVWVVSEAGEGQIRGPGWHYGPFISPWWGGPQGTGGLGGGYSASSLILRHTLMWCWQYWHLSCWMEPLRPLNYFICKQLAATSGGLTSDLWLRGGSEGLLRMCNKAVEWDSLKVVSYFCWQVN